MVIITIISAEIKAKQYLWRWISVIPLTDEKTEVFAQIWSPLVRLCTQLWSCPPFLWRPKARLVSVLS